MEVLAKCAIFALCLFTWRLETVSCANILVLHPLHGGSHKLQLEILSNQLVARGHNVSSISFANVGDGPQKESNITKYILTVNNTDGRYPYMSSEETGRFEFPGELFWSRGHNPHYLPLNAFKMTEALCRGLLSDSSWIESLRNLRFDIAIVDLISNECGLGLVDHLGIETVVAYWALFPTNGEMDYIGSFQPPSWVPSFLSKLPQRMGFLDRVYNTYLRIGGLVVMELQFHLSHHYIQEYFPGSPHPKELIANLSGILINSDFALDYPKLLPPNAVNVGCMQCGPGAELPQELEEFMEKGEKEGVVVFSMGASFDAAVSSSLLPKLFHAFSRLPQLVLMKIRLPPQHSKFVKIPPNVKIISWFPQQHVLAHRNTILFFTHCGLHGVLESMWHGVPMVGMPIFGDQFDVVVRIKERGLGLELDKHASADTIYETVSRVLGSGDFKKNSKRFQALLQDQKEHPMERALWLIQYLSRTEGGAHLKMGNRHLNLFQLYCLDVILVLALIFLVLLWSIYKTIPAAFAFSNKLSSCLLESVQNFIRDSRRQKKRVETSLARNEKTD